MEKQDLINYKEKLAKLSEEEKKKRDLHLRQLATGEVQGPPVGYSSIDKSWLKHYTEKDLEYKIPKCSIYEYMRKNCMKYSLNTWMEFGSDGKTLKISYLQGLKMIEKTAKALKQSGVKKGDYVSVCMPNTPEVAYIFYAINKIGAIANMLDPRTNPENLKASINDSKSKIMLSLDQFCPIFEKMTNETQLEKIVGISPIASIPKIIRNIITKKKPGIEAKLPENDKIISWEEFINQGKYYVGKTEEKYEPNMDAIIAYTGGTTGQSKGVIATNENLNAMIIENSKMNFNVKPGDKCLNIAPPWTYYGISNCLNAFTHLGTTSIMIPQFGPDDLGKLVYEYKPNHIISVPSTLIAMMKEKNLQNMDLSFIKTIIVGADKLEPTFELEFNEWLKKHNSKCKITKGYGMTEVTAAASYTRDDINKPGNVGIPFIAETISIFDPETGEELPTGKTGEIAFKGPKNTKGYYGINSSKNEEVYKKHEDGDIWVHSGDLGHLDENGILYVDGRLKRMFTTYGFKVFAGDIEKHIYENPAVQQCAIIPIKDESTGSKIKAIIVVKDEYKLKEKEIQEQIDELLKEKVFSYEIPSEYEFRDELPLTGMNKINYTLLEKEENEKKEKEGFKK